MLDMVVHQTASDDGRTSIRIFSLEAVCVALYPGFINKSQTASKLLSMQQ
jgi:hypothetical protein